LDTLVIIIEEMRKRRITQKELCQKLGIHQQAFTNWKNGTTDSYMKKLPQIAEILDVSTDYLLGNADDPTPKSKKAFTAEDEPIDEVRRKLHEIIDSLSASDKEAMLYMAQSLMKRDEQKGE